jgi:hypothetical protein
MIDPVPGGTQALAQLPCGAGRGPAGRVHEQREGRSPCRSSPTSRCSGCTAACPRRAASSAASASASSNTGQAHRRRHRPRVALGEHGRGVESAQREDAAAVRVVRRLLEHGAAISRGVSSDGRSAQVEVRAAAEEALDGGGQPVADGDAEQRHAVEQAVHRRARRRPAPR